MAGRATAVLGTLLVTFLTLAYTSEPPVMPNCITMKGQKGVLEVQCSGEEGDVTATLTPGVLLSVQCSQNNTKPEDLEMLYGLSDKPVSKVKFFLCPLPKVNLGSLIENILGSHLSNINTLVFQSHRNIEDELKREHFKGLFNISRLELSSNQLTSLPEDLLEDMPSLTWVELRNNALVTLPPGLFSASPNLSVLELGSNKLSSLPPMLFNNLTSLRLLNLWGNSLANLDRNIFTQLPKLETIDLSSNGLIELDANVFHDLVSLKDINLSSNNLKTLPEGLLNYSSKLERLRLIDNRAETLELPGALFADLPRLRHLRLDRSGLKSLPNDVFRGVVALTNLTLQGNYIETLPGEIFQDAKNLSMLDISSNIIDKLPDTAFVGLKVLKYLKLYNNTLTSISKELFQPLEQLELLDLSRNHLEQVDHEAFSNMPRLKVAKFTNNHLTFSGTYRDAFGFYSPLHVCKELEEIHLANNSLTEVFGDWMLLMLKLRTLDLRNNSIRGIKFDDLQFSSTDITVDLRGNEIAEVDMSNAELLAQAQGTEGRARNVRALLANNPINCSSCATFELLQYRERRVSKAVRDFVRLDMEDVRCAGNETPLSHLSSTSFTCPLPHRVCHPGCKCDARLGDRALVIQCCHQPDKLPTLARLNRTELTSSGCGLRKLIDVRNVTGYDRITALRIAHNNISQLSVEQLPPRLEILELHNNNLTHLSEEVLERLMDNTSDLSYITLRGNPWHCDCEARGLLAFMQERFKIVADLGNVTCDDERPMAQLSASDLCPPPVTLAASMAVAAAGVILGALAALYYRFQKNIKVWLYAHRLCLWLVTEDELDKDKLYDAFVSYAHQDEQFVVKHLMPGLEPPYKLLIHIRDWIPGDWIPEQITRSVEQSRRTLVVLSPSFVESVWGRLEFRAAHQQALTEKRARVILIILEDVGPVENLDPELRTYLSMNTYVKWGDPWFWDKLRYALPHRPADMAKDSGGWGWGRRRVRDVPSVSTRRIEDELELTRSSMNLNTHIQSVITSPPTSNDKTLPTVAITTNGTNGHHVRAV